MPPCCSLLSLRLSQARSCSAGGCFCKHPGWDSQEEGCCCLHWGRRCECCLQGMGVWTAALQHSVPLILSSSKKCLPAGNLVTNAHVDDVAAAFLLALEVLPTPYDTASAIHTHSIVGQAGTILLPLITARLAVMAT